MYFQEYSKALTRKVLTLILEQFVFVEEETLAGVQQRVRKDTMVLNLQAG